MDFKLFYFLEHLGVHLLVQEHCEVPVGLGEEEATLGGMDGRQGLDHKLLRSAHCPVGLWVQMSRFSRHELHPSCQSQNHPKLGTASGNMQRSQTFPNLQAPGLHRPAALNQAGFLGRLYNLS